MLQGSRIFEFCTKKFQHQFLYEYGYLDLSSKMEFIFLMINVRVIKIGVTIGLKSYSNNKIKSILNKALRKKRIRYVFAALQNVKPCGM